MERTDRAGTRASGVQLGGDVEGARVGFEYGVQSRAVAVERLDAVEVGAHGLDGRTRPVVDRLRKLHGVEFRDVREQAGHVVRQTRHEAELAQPSVFSARSQLVCLTGSWLQMDQGLWP